MCDEISFQKRLIEIKKFLKAGSFFRRDDQGQNFLFHFPTLLKIIKAAQIEKDDCVLEIGSGPATLTSLLTASAGYVLGVEKDERFKNLHEPLFKDSSNIRFIYKDALRLNDDDMKILSGSEQKNLKAIGNIPYNITTPLITNLVSAFIFETITLLIQREVAERLASKPGSKSFGIMSVRTQFFYEPKIAFIVPPNLFSPPPQVHSALICLKKRESLHIPDESEQRRFFKMIEKMFSKRRKTSLNTLLETGFVSIPKSEVISVAEKNGIDLNKRPEALPVEEFVKIYKLFCMANKG